MRRMKDTPHRGVRVRVRRALLVSAGVLLLAASALAHTPPPVYLTMEAGEEKLVSTISVQNEIFRDWFGLDPLALKTLEGDERRAARRKVADLLATWSSVEIDRVPVKGVVKSLKTQNYMHQGMEWNYVLIEVVYGTKGMPREVGVTWRNFDTSSGWVLPNIDAEIAVGAGGAYFRFTEEEPEVIWHAPLEETVKKEAWEPPPVRIEKLSIPVATVGSLLLAGITLLLTLLRRLPRRTGLAASAALLLLGGLLTGSARVEVTSPWQKKFTMPSREQALLIFETLHRNIYRAFDYDTDEDIYDTLAHSVSGELLTRVYSEVYESLIMREAGGAVAKVQSTRILEARVELPGDPDARFFKVDCRWRVVGKIGHWGHTHQRTNEYRAIYTVSHEKAGWRIADVEVVDQKRVENTGADGWENQRKNR